MILGDSVCLHRHYLDNSEEVNGSRCVAAYLMIKLDTDELFFQTQVFSRVKRGYARIRFN